MWPTALYQLPLPPQVPKPEGRRQSPMFFELHGALAGQPTVGLAGSHNTTASVLFPPLHALGALHVAVLVELVTVRQHTSPWPQFAALVHPSVVGGGLCPAPASGGAHAVPFSQPNEKVPCDTRVAQHT